MGDERPAGFGATAVASGERERGRDQEEEQEEEEHEQKTRSDSIREGDTVPRRRVMQETEGQS